MSEEKIPLPIITHEMMKRVFDGEDVQLLLSPGKGYSWQVNKDGTISKVPVAKVIYE